MTSPWVDEGAVEEAMDDLHRAGLHTVRDTLPELSSRPRSYGARPDKVKGRLKGSGSGGAAGAGSAGSSVPAHGRGGKARGQGYLSGRTHGKLEMSKVKFPWLEGACWDISGDLQTCRAAKERGFAVFVASPLPRSCSRSLGDPVTLETECFRCADGRSGDVVTPGGLLLDM
jgi:hypothetical protein